jgi:hypothetical protein
LIAVDEGTTEVVITHERFASAEAAKNHERGWTQLLALIDSHVTEQL